MKRYIYTLLAFVSVFFLFGTFSCKTTEKNYRQAYEQAVSDEGHEVTEFEHTIYNRYRAQMKDITVKVDGENVPAKSIFVKVTKDGGGINEWLKKYCVVVAEFKQLFNANSMRERFAAAGYPRAFLIENAEPYYYVVVESSDNAAELLPVIEKLKEHSPIPIKPDFPYLMLIPNR